DSVDNDSSDDEDGGDDDESDANSSEDEDDFGPDWTMDRFLDVPVWLNQLQPLCFDTLNEFERFQMTCEHFVQQNLLKYDYNTFGSFVQFYDQYAAAKQKDADLHLNDFLCGHKAQFDRTAMSCVGLSIVLLQDILSTAKVYKRYE